MCIRDRVATIRDDSEMTIKLSFPADEAASFHVGQAAVVTLYGSFETINGTVSEISGASYAVDGNMIAVSYTHLDMLEIYSSVFLTISSKESSCFSNSITFAASIVSPADAERLLKTYILTYGLISS